MFSQIYRSGPVNEKNRFGHAALVITKIVQILDETRTPTTFTLSYYDFWLKKIWVDQSRSKDQADLPHRSFVEIGVKSLMVINRKIPWSYLFSQELLASFERYHML